MAEIAIVGAGPAGLMAAQSAIAADARVTVFEAKRTAGRKFLVAGKGGLNLTHAEPLEAFVTRYREAAPRLEPFIREFPPARLRAFVDGLGQKTWVGSSGRVFPNESKAAPLLRTWIARLKKAGVTFIPRTRWLGFSEGMLLFETWPDATRTKGNLREFLEGGTAEARLKSDATVLALGGGSWPETGSDGSWVSILREAGVEVRDLAPSNCGFDVEWPSAFLSKAEGKALKNVALSIGGETARGDVIVTKRGIEGPPVYRLSPLLRAAAPAEIALDLKPDLTAEQVGAKLAKKALKLDPIAKALLGKRLDLVKSFPLRMERPRPVAEAISSAGGVVWSELDDSLMLRKRPGVFVAGEMIDWEAPTGGYLLQACFATGFAAGLAAARWADEHRS